MDKPFGKGPNGCAFSLGFGALCAATLGLVLLGLELLFDPVNIK